MSKKTIIPLVSMCFALVLAVIKLVAGALSGSISVLTVALDSVFDVFMSGFSFIVLKKSDKPADENHPYGHEKFEALGVLLQSSILTVLVCIILFSAVGRLLDNEPFIIQSQIAIVAMIISTIISGILAIYLYIQSSKHNSNILKGELLHYLPDFFTNLLVLIGLIVAKYTGLINLDAWLSILIALYMLYSIAKIFISSIKELSDNSAFKEIKEPLNAALKKYEDITLGARDIRCRKAGNKIFLDMTLVLCSDITLNQGHEIVTSIEQELMGLISDIDIRIYMEPCDYDDYKNLKCTLKNCNQTLDS